MTKKLLPVLVTCFCIITITCAVAAKAHTTKIRSNLIKTAKKYVGTKYRYGGNKKSGFDCSGFVMFVFHQHDVQLPRTSHAQYRYGKKIPAKDARPGDLVFFRISGSQISHVGIFLGNSAFIHSPSSGKKIMISDFHASYWQERLAGFVRYLP